MTAPDMQLDYVYYFNEFDDSYQWKSVPVTKVTARRVYIQKRHWIDGRVAALDKAALLSEGSVYHRPTCELYHTRADMESIIASQRPGVVQDAAAALGLGCVFTRADVVSAYRQQARRSHPDVGGSNEAMRLLTEARDQAMKYATA